MTTEPISTDGIARAAEQISASKALMITEIHLACIDGQHVLVNADGMMLSRRELIVLETGAKQALSLIDKLVPNWDATNYDQFVTAVNKQIPEPAASVSSQLKDDEVYLYLFQNANNGKYTLGWSRKTSFYDDPLPIYGQSVNVLARFVGTMEDEDKLYKLLNDYVVDGWWIAYPGDLTQYFSDYFTSKPASV